MNKKEFYKAIYGVEFDVWFPLFHEILVTSVEKAAPIAHARFSKNGFFKQEEIEAVAFFFSHYALAGYDEAAWKFSWFDTLTREMILESVVDATFGVDENE